MRRLLPLVLLLLVACDKTPEAPDDPPGGGNETPSNIQGLLVVHVPIRPSKEDLRGAYALLGVEVDAFSRADVHAYEDFFGKDELHDGVVTQRDTKLLGYVDLQ